MTDCKACEGAEWDVMVVAGEPRPWVCACVKPFRRLAVAKAGPPPATVARADWLRAWHNNERTTHDPQDPSR